MSIMQKQKSRDPRAGYARDFVPLMERILPRHRRSAASGSSPTPAASTRGAARGGAAACRAPGTAGPVARSASLPATTSCGRLDELIARGNALRDMETGEPLSDIRDRVLSANAYLGAFPIVEALAAGADVVVTGRVTDTGLTLAPIVHEFGWSPDDWDKLAAGTVAGHIIECGAQCPGGNCQVERETIRTCRPRLPHRRGDAGRHLRRHQASRHRRRVSVASVTEQLVYEMGDPRSYITPDGVADFTTIRAAAAPAATGCA